MTDVRTVRVVVEDTWDQVTLELPPSTPLSEVKQRALALTHTAGDPAAFELKFRGASLADETRALSEAGVVTNAQLIVLRRRRRAVR